jgi:hypothetical protein
MLSSVESVATRQLRLPELGLVPDGTFEDIARSTVSLATDGFYEAIADGRISVLKDNTIRGFLEDDGRPFAELADGTTIPADLVVCGTGFRQQVPFFDEGVRKQLTDDRGNFELYRQILPHDVPNLTFAGYNSSLFSPLSAEMSAVWIASHLAGLHQVPPVEERRRMVAPRIAWMEKRTNGHRPGHQHHPVLDAQHRRGPQRARPEHRDGYAGPAVAAAGQPKVLPQGREKAQEALPAGEPTPDTPSPPQRYSR